MSQVATLAVVEGKLAPITAAQDVVPSQFTAQAAINLFGEFTTAVNSAGGSQCRILQAFAYQSRNASQEEVRLALSGVVESTRISEENKRIDTAETPMARKFQSMARAIWGAIRFAGFGLDEAGAYVNSQSLYDDCRKALAEHGIDWKGLTDAEKAQSTAKKATVKAMKEVAEEEGADDVLALTPEQFSTLKAKAAAKLADKAAKAKLESMEKRAEKLAKDLVASYGLDDAESVLKAALENLTKVAMGAI